MLRYALPLVAVSAAALAAPAAAAEIQIQATGPVVELAITEAVKSRPDIANIGAGVTTLAPTAVEAMRLNAQQMTGVVDRIKALGIKAEDIQTSGINLFAQYDYDQEARKQVFRGYQASNRVGIVLRKPEDAGKVLDALVVAGATDLSGPDFALDNDAAAKASARKAAFDRAGAQALDYAKMAGFSGLRLLEVSEAVQTWAPQPMMVRTQAANVEQDASTPVEPGRVATSVTVTVKYEMTR